MKLTILTNNSSEFITQWKEKDQPQLINNQQDMDKLSISSIDLLPNEIMIQIFGFLSPEDLSQTSLVCREWSTLAFDKHLCLNVLDLKELFPSLKVIDEIFWKKYADLNALELSIKDAPPLSKSIIVPALTSLFDSSSSIVGESKVTFLTIPKGLTLAKLITFAEFPKQGNRIKLHFIASNILELKDVPVDKTYRVAITNVLKGSQGLSIKKKRELVKKIGCEMSELLPLAAFVILTFMNSQEQLSPTHCSEEINGDNLVVENSASSGLGVSFYLNYGKVGVTAMRKF